MEDNFSYTKRNNNDYNTVDKLNTSYKIVNEKVFKLKKLEFDYANLCEVVKNYIIVQEIIAKHLFDNKSEFSDESLARQDDFKNKMEVIDKLLYIVHDTLFYKSEDLEDDPIIIRKIIMRLLKNQKMYLTLVANNNSD